jgi:hypothetical protein
MRVLPPVIGLEGIPSLGEAVARWKVPARDNVRERYREALTASF